MNASSWLPAFVLRSEQAWSLFHSTLGTASMYLKRNREPGWCSRGWAYFTVPFDSLPSAPWQLGLGVGAGISSPSDSFPLSDYFLVFAKEQCHLYQKKKKNSSKKQPHYFLVPRDANLDLEEVWGKLSNYPTPHLVMSERQAMESQDCHGLCSNS